MREKILEVLKLNRSNALTIEEIYDKIFHSTKEDKLLESLREEINNLLGEKLVYCTNSNKGLYTLNPFREGIFYEKRNKEMYVVSNDEIIKIESNKIYALPKDKVLVRITDYNSMKGNLKEIVERNGIIAEVKTIKGKKYAITENNKYQIDLPSNIVDGMMIGIKIDKNKAGKFLRANLDKVLGHKNAPKLDEIKILYENGAMEGFSKETIEEAKNMPFEVKDEDIKGRVDLRKELIFTIDGDDTKDIDDAISIEVLENGNYKLGVHIADVTYYVKENSYLDKDARFKATSIYMPGVVEPMYPVNLSNGICSLNPNVDRLAISCIMEFDNNGDLITFDIFKSVINSKIQMTYSNVNKILEEDIIVEGYEPYIDSLKKMKTLADILHKMRVRRGLLEFSSNELKINVDNNGKVINIEERVQKTGENLIEDFMLAANECVATYVYNMGLNFIYRVHDYPNEEKLVKTINVIKTYGETFKGKINIKDPKVIGNLLKELEQTKNYDIYSNMILRCMAKACYKNINEGHFGIGIDDRKNEAYTHFTSPIRRYPDTTVHRILTYILEGNTSYIQSEIYNNNLIDITTHSSEMEKVADKCEREANKMKMADYISKYIGLEYDGKITGFTATGMYVMLDNFVEGRISFSSMDDYYVYNEELEVIVGERTKKVYRLGEKVKIKVVRADKDAREIDFEMVGNGRNGNIKQKSKFQLFRRR